jgi:signal transduction histidine kinase
VETLYVRRSTAERLIALARVALAATSLLAIWLDPSEPTKYRDIAYALLVGYLGYALLLVPLVWLLRAPLGLVAIITHGIDLVAFTGFIYFTEGPTSPFFAYFVFSLFCATLRWQRSGTFWTALVVLTLFLGLGLYTALVLKDPDFELNRFIVRSVYLALVALLLAYLSTYEQHIRGQLAKLAAWSSWAIPPNASQTPIQEILRHAAGVLEAPRMLMVWDEQDEPFRHVAYFTPGEFHWTHESPLAFEPLVAEPLSNSDFLCPDAGALDARVLRMDAAGFHAWSGSPLNPELRARFRIDRILCSVLSEADFQGRLLFLDKPEMTADDLVLGRIATSQVAAAMSQLAEQRNRLKTAVTDERLHVARDLHDSLLQTLAGTALQLEAVRRSLSENPEAARKQLKEIQTVIAEEQRGLRSFIQQLKSPPATPVSVIFALDARLDRLARRIGRQWGLKVELSIRSDHGGHSGKLPREVYPLVHEALINSARHAGATQVVVMIETAKDHVHIRVKDNGRGFAFQGRHDLADLMARGLGPKSLKERIAGSGGELFIDSSGGGACLDMRLPLRPQPPLPAPLPTSNPDSRVTDPKG